MVMIQILSFDSREEESYILIDEIPNLSNNVFNLSVKRTFMASVASQAEDADSSLSSGLWHQG